MRKRIAQLLVCLGILLSVAICQANLDDTRVTIEQKYGPYRLVIDTDNQLWAKDDWEKKGQFRAKAASYMHTFTRHGMQIQMEVTYDTKNADSYVRGQRFTPAMSIQIKEFKKYFPEFTGLLDAPKGTYFTTGKAITRQFQEDQSPITMGLVVKQNPHKSRSSWYTLMAFNIQDEGRLVKEAQYVNGDLYIREFTIEPILMSTTTDELDFGSEWKVIKKYF